MSTTTAPQPTVQDYLNAVAEVERLEGKPGYDAAVQRLADLHSAMGR